MSNTALARCCLCEAAIEAGASPYCRSCAEAVAAELRAALEPAPEVHAWLAQNPWFNTNLEAQAVAVALMGIIDQQMPAASLDERLAETTRRMRFRYTELFPDQHPAPGQPEVESVARAIVPALTDPTGTTEIPIREIFADPQFSLIAQIARHAAALAIAAIGSPPQHARRWLTTPLIFKLARKRRRTAVAHAA